MLIEEIMKSDVITVEPSDSIKLAMLIIQQHRIRHLPVVIDKRLIGIVTDRDIRDACPSRFDHDDHSEILEKPISEIMVKDVITAHPRDFVEEAAYVLSSNKIGCLPVIDQGQLVGIVTETDILNTLIELMGVHYPSSHIEVEVDDRIGMLADVAQIFKENHLNVSSVLVFPGRRPNKKNLVFRVQTIDPRRIVKAIYKKGYHVIWPKVAEVDHE